MPEEAPILPLSNTLAIRVNPQEAQQQYNTKLPTALVEQHNEDHNIAKNINCEGTRYFGSRK